MLSNIGSQLVRCRAIRRCLFSSLTLVAAQGGENLSLGQRTKEQSESKAKPLSEGRRNIHITLTAL